MIKKIIICFICLTIIGGSFAIASEALNNPPDLPTDPNPEDGAIGIGIKTHLSWTGGDQDPGDNAVYDVYFGTENEPGLVVSNLQMPNYNPNILEKNTKYYWKVIAHDESQEETAGPLWTFTTNDCDCDPPDKPSGPTRTRNRNRYEYTTKIMIQNQNGLYYNFSWGDGNFSGWLGPYNHNERVRAEYQWNKSGSYQVQARARFQNGVKNMFEWTTTGWSEPLIVEVTVDNPENNPPSTPIINGTKNGKIGIEYDYSFKSNDLDGDDIYYYVEFCEGCTDSTWYGPYPSDYHLTLSHIWNESSMFNIRVKSKDIYDSESDWAILEVNIPKTRIFTNNIVVRFVENHPHIFPLLRMLINI